MSQRAAFAGLMGGLLASLALVPAVWFVVPASLVGGLPTLPVGLAVFLGLLVVPILVGSGFWSAAAGRNDLLDGVAGGGFAGVVAYGCCVGPAAAVGGQWPVIEAMSAAPLHDGVAVPLAFAVVGAASAVYPWFWILLAGGAALGGLGGLARSFREGHRDVRVIGHRIQGSSALSGALAAALVTVAMAGPVAALQDRIGREVPVLGGESIVAWVLGTQLALLGALLAWCWTLTEGRIHHPNQEVRGSARFIGATAAVLGPAEVVAVALAAPDLLATFTFVVSALLVAGITLLGAYRAATLPTQVLPEDHRLYDGLSEAASGGVLMGVLFVATVGPSILFAVSIALLSVAAIDPLTDGPPMSAEEIRGAVRAIYRTSAGLTAALVLGATALTTALVPLLTRRRAHPDAA